MESAFWIIVLKGFILVGAFGLLGLFVSRGIPARRHLVWIAAAVGLLALPVINLAGVKWEIPIGTVSEPKVEAPTHFRIIPPTSPQMSERTVSATPASAATPSTADPIDWSRVAFWTWMVGSLLIGFRLILGLAAVRRLISRGRTWHSSAAASVLGNDNRRIRVLLVRGLDIPATAGLRRPAILLPEAATDWLAEKVRMVVAHEYAHVLRHDWFWQIVAQAACATHALNPLAWFVASRTRAESELACDDLVIGMGFDRDAYAATLLDVARSSRYQLAATVGMARKSDVESRIASILRSRGTAGGVRTRTVMLASVLAIAVAVPLAWVRPVLASERAPSDGEIIVAKGYEAVLPSGLRVSLRGITDKPMSFDLLAPDDVWQPDGSAWKGEMSDPRKLEFGWGNTFIKTGTQETHRALLIEVSTDKPRKITKSGYVPSVSSWDTYSDEMSVRPDRPNRMLATNLDFGSPAADRYRLAIGDQPWKRDREVRSNLRQTSVSQGIRITFGKGIIAETSGQRQALDTESTLSSRDWRVVPVDAEGKELPVPGAFMNPNWKCVQLTVAESRQIKGFRIESRPWTWVEFRNLHAEPAARTKSIRLGTATGVSPNAEVDYGDGLGFRVLGIASTSPAGSHLRPDAWWRGDGRLLAEPPLSGDAGYPVGKGVARALYIPISLGVYKQGVREPIGACMIATVVPEKDETSAFGSPYGWMYAYGNSIGTTMTVNLGKAGSHATAIVGYANGPWHTVSRLDCDVDSIVPTPGHHRFIGFTIGKESTVRFTSRNVKIAMKFSARIDPIRTAVRVLAVDRNGKRHLIKSDMGGNGSSISTHFDPDDKEDFLNREANNAKIVAFELETCPFAYAYLRKLALQPAK